jgi:hypothetical protein
MKTNAFWAIVGMALLVSACAGRSGPAQSATGVRAVTRIQPAGLWGNGVSSNGAAFGAMTLDGVEVVQGQLVRR